MVDNKRVRAYCPVCERKTLQENKKCCTCNSKHYNGNYPAGETTDGK